MIWSCFRARKQNYEANWQCYWFDIESSGFAWLLLLHFWVHYPKFCNKNQITTEDYSQHYQMTGLTNHTFILDFKLVFNCLKSCTTCWNCYRYTEPIGKKVYKSFVDERIKVNVSILSTMKKRNLKILQIQGKSIKTKIGEQLLCFSLTGNEFLNSIPHLFLSQ